MKYGARSISTGLCNGIIAHGLLSASKHVLHTKSQGRALEEQIPEDAFGEGNLVTHLRGPHISCTTRPAASVGGKLLSNYIRLFSLSASTTDRVAGEGWESGTGDQEHEASTTASAFCPFTMNPRASRMSLPGNSTKAGSPLVEMECMLGIYPDTAAAGAVIWAHCTEQPIVACFSGTLLASRER